jgi:malonyl-CoA O-methyltransferase
LVAHGDQFSEEQLQYLHSLTSDIEPEELLLGLGLLAELDNTPYLSSVQCPALHLLGQRDALVPESSAESLISMLPKHHSVQVLTNRGHCLHQPMEDISPVISGFLSGLESND